MECGPPGKAPSLAGRVENRDLMACPNQAHCSGYWESRNHLSLSFCLAKAKYKRIARGIDRQLVWTNKGHDWSGSHPDLECVSFNILRDAVLEVT